MCNVCHRFLASFLLFSFLTEWFNLDFLFVQKTIQEQSISLNFPVFSVLILLIYLFLVLSSYDKRIRCIKSLLFKFLKFFLSIIKLIFEVFLGHIGENTSEYSLFDSYKVLHTYILNKFSGFNLSLSVFMSFFGLLGLSGSEIIHCFNFNVFKISCHQELYNILVPFYLVLRNQ